MINPESFFASFLNLYFYTKIQKESKSAVSCVSTSLDKTSWNLRIKIKKQNWKKKLHQASIKALGMQVAIPSPWSSGFEYMKPWNI